MALKSRIDENGKLVIYYAFDESITFTDWDRAYRWLATEANLHRVNRKS